MVSEHPIHLQRRVEVRRSVPHPQLFLRRPKRSVRNKRHQGRSEKIPARLQNLPMKNGQAGSQERDSRLREVGSMK